MRNIGAHLPIDLDKATPGNTDTGFLRIDFLAIGSSTHRLQHEIVALGLGGSCRAFETYPYAIVARFGADRFRFEHHFVETRRIHFLPDFDQIARSEEHTSELQSL